MALGLIGKKLGMSQIFDEHGNVIPVTVIKAGPCYVVQKKSAEKEGYNAVQIGFDEVIKVQRVNKPETGHFKKADVTPTKILKEIKVGPEDLASNDIGSIHSVDIFEPGDFVDITGTSKGKGFAGVMKRHNFRGGPGGHGSHAHREPGSVGQCATPSRVFKGVGMPGQMGGDTVTVRNVEVVRIDAEQNLLLVKGAVPGGKDSLLTIRLA